MVYILLILIVHTLKRFPSGDGVRLSMTAHGVKVEVTKEPHIYNNAHRDSVRDAGASESMQAEPCKLLHRCGMTNYHQRSIRLSEGKYLIERSLKGKKK